MSVLAAMAGAAAAQSGADSRPYPYKPLRWVTGGGPDAMARILGQKITDAWGQQVVVEERGGGGGMLSAEVVARATPDGYTLLLATGTHTISPNYFKVPYDIVRDFATVSLLGTITFILSVHPSLPVNSVQEFIALARAKPGTINFTSGGNGSPAHTIMEYLRLKAPINAVHVPYRTVGQAVTTQKRSAVMPELPTMVEAGIPHFDAAAWNGLMVPANTPHDIINKLHARVTAELKLPDVVERTQALAFELVDNSPAEFAKFLKAELDKWARVAKATRASVE